MANNSVVTQQKLQEFYDTKIYDYLNGATHTGCVPLGTILPYFGETAPTHFLICDGTEYAKADYPELAEHLLALTDPTPYAGSDTNHFKVPDLRGEFLRGSGTNGHTNNGNGANVGVHQDSTYIKAVATGGSHEFWIATNNTDQTIVTNPDKQVMGTMGVDYYTRDAHNDNISTIEKQSLRPTNTSVTYIIAYRNAYIDLALDSFPIDISQPTDGQLLMWDATAGRWVNGGHKYSTDEHVVGTWIDGKPIYEKTIIPDLSKISYLSDLTVRQTINIMNISDLNIDEGISITGGIVANKTLNGILWPLAAQQEEETDYDRYYFVYFGPDYLTITFRGSNYFTQALDNYPNSKLIATIRYIKTTD